MVVSGAVSAAPLPGIGGGPVEELWLLLRQDFLARAGWDSEIGVLVPARDDVLLGLRECAVVDCQAATRAGWAELCSVCWKRHKATGLTLEQFVARSHRVRERLIAPTALQILRLDVSVVFDFAGNTVAHRAWVRSIFEAAGAGHVLHVLDVPDDECKRRVRERNVAKPAGLYFGDVSDEIFDSVLPYITPPSESECFRVVRH